MTDDIPSNALDEMAQRFGEAPKLPKKVVAPTPVRPPNKWSTDTQPVIVEGMDRDNTNINLVVAHHAFPPGIGIIIPGWGSYELDYRGTLNGTKLINNGAPGQVKYKYEQSPWFESTQTMILGDGRVYSWASNDRLDITIERILLLGGPIDAYNVIKANPKAFCRD